MKVNPGRSVIAAGLTLLGLTLSVVMASVKLLDPPLKDLMQLALFLLASGGIALAIGYLAAFLGGRPLFRSVRLRLLLVPVMVVLIALANVWFIAQLMFISEHDLALLSLVLLFSLGISAFMAYLLSESLRSSIRQLAQGVQEMINGDFKARAEVSGQDEIGELAEAFNVMAARTEAAFERQREVVQARRDMVVAVSHDLRTPLASIRAMVESINDGVVSDTETVHRYLLTLEGEVGRLSRLVDDLFELTQIDAGVLRLHREKTSMHDLISDTLESMTAQAHQRGLVLKGQVEDEALTVLVDTARVHRVLLNLVQNAIHHTPSEGTICIQVCTQGKEVQVEVTDTGEGIAAGDLDAVFERFYQGDKSRARNGGNSGLGLSVAKAIVEAHGGRIWVKSTSEQGSTFAFTLPKYS